MNKTIKQILVTCALPYANGSIHLGHLLEHIQADIWVRYQKIVGHQVYFICSDDAHGTPVMLKAKKLGINPEKMIKNIHLEHKNDLSRFNIDYDNYYTTHSEENYMLSILIYNKLKDCGYIKSQSVIQLFDPQENMFLPDRFVKGSCPKCYSINQYGDNCEICGATYNSTDLINPKSVISGVTPILKESEHFFFDLPLFSNILYSWIHSGLLQKEVVNKLHEWFSLGLQRWNISRDAPYFGFKIPGMLNKYFYVWLDAPIGYMSSFKNFCNYNKNISFNDFWSVDSKTELYHFIGKDIIYFHGLFWPALLEASGFRKPTNLFVHGYLTVNGTKMSKSRGTYITASNYLKYLDADCLRYYYATKLSSGIEDVDFNFDDFIQKFNSDIINKVINLASRNASFINNFFHNQLASVLADQSLYNIFVDAAISIGDFYHNRETSKAVRKIMLLADLANKYIDAHAPWIMVKKYNYNTDVHNICTMGIELFRILITYLKPVLPSLTKKVEIFLNTELHWNSVDKPLLSHYIRPFKLLFNRINICDIKNIFCSI